MGIVVSAVTLGSATSLDAVLVAVALGGASAGLTGALLNGSNLGQIAKSTFTGGFWGTVGGFLAFDAGSGDPTFFERLFKHSFSQT